MKSQFQTLELDRETRDFSVRLLRETLIFMLIFMLPTHKRMNEMPAPSDQ